MRALGLALRSRDGRGGPTALAGLVPAHFDLPDPEAVLTAVYTGELEYGRLFELARVCLDAAGGGDAPAIEAVTLLADEVAAMITAMVGRLGVEGEDVEVVLGGGVFDSGYRRVRRARREPGPGRGPAGPVPARSTPPRSSAPPCWGSMPSGLPTEPRTDYATRHHGPA